jgi:hypothetical protein
MPDVLFELEYMTQSLAVILALLVISIALLAMVSSATTHTFCSPAKDATD